MIPTVEDIVSGLLLKLYTYEQAIGWLRSHIGVAEDAMDAQDMRDTFACAAMQGLACDVMPERIVNEAGETEADVQADRAYLIADAMLKRRNK